MFLAFAVAYLGLTTSWAQPGNSTEKLLTDASAALSSNDLSRAETVLQRVLVAAPRNVEAHTLAGAVAERQNDLTAAEKHFAIAAKLQPKSSETRNNYGAILFRVGRAAEAAKEFEASLSINPGQRSAQVNLAQIYFAKGTAADLRAADRLFEKAFAAAPDVEVARALVVIALRLGETERAARDYPQYSALVKNSVLPNAARIELGAALLESRLIAEAVSELEAAFAVEPDNPNVVVSLSRAYLARKDIKNAGRTLEAAVSRGVDDAKIYAALADVYEAGGYYENAIPAMRLAIERDPRSEPYRFRYGLMLVDTKAPAAAVIRLTEAIKDFPASARLWLGLGIAQYSDSKTVEAQQSLKKALELNPRLVPALAYLAAIEDEIGKSTEAAINYERALALDDKNAVLNYLLAETLMKNAAIDTERTEKHLRRAIESDAGLAAAHLALGRLYVRGKRFAEAAAALEKTVRLQPNRAEAFYQLGQVYIRLKRADESRAALAKFKELSELEKTQTRTDRNELVRRLANVKF
ncbi:MAG TPA: tetratricopeptide repeat protein [Pyrinomonadaceae bacterium]|nr:tetratricopeptide repeat protein [Pyrinomonadaceae bacterium]